MGVRKFGIMLLFLIILELKIADSNRIIFPNELEQIKAQVAADTQATKTNSLEEPPEVSDANVRNMIVVPPNCPPGQQPDADGVCRDIF